MGDDPGVVKEGYYSSNMANFPSMLNLCSFYSVP